jgi:hypothetical protein
VVTDRLKTIFHLTPCEEEESEEIHTG